MSIRKNGVLIAGSSTGSTEAKIWAEGTDEQVQALGGEKSAKGYAESISDDAQAANQAKLDAEAAATEAQSYAKGGTETRAGEDTDNAEYYAEQARLATEGKAEKPTGEVTEGELAALTEDGNLKTTGIPSDNVAQQDGSYDNMHVGTAGNLVDPDATPSPAAFFDRTTAGDVSVSGKSPAIIDAMFGSTEVANQLVKPTNDNTVTGEGTVEVTDAVAGNANGLTMYGDAYVRNQLVPATAQPRSASGDGAATVSDAVAGSATKAVLKGSSYIRNQLVNTTGDVSLSSDHVYLFNDNGVVSRITRETTQAVTADEDMLVDLTQLTNGDATKINSIQTWEDLVARYPEYKDHVAYDTGTVIGSQPVFKNFGDEYAYGIIMDTTNDDIPCQRVEYHNGIITNVESFSSLPAHDWHRCVMDNLSTRHINYYLDPTDSTKKYNGTYKGVTSDGSASVLTGADGDFMLEIDVTHWRVTQNYAGEGKHLYLVSDKPFKGSRPHRFFYTSPDGGTLRTQYVGAVRACVCDADGNPLNTTEGALSQNSGTASTRKARSLAGALPWVQMQLSDLRTASTRNGGSVVNFDFHQYVYLMMMIEYATVNTQAISLGYSNGKTYDRYWAWRKAGRTNYGNGTGQTFAVSNTTDDDNFYSLKVNNVQLYRDAAIDANGYYGWSNHTSSPTRYWTSTATPANGSTAYSDTNGTASAYTTTSWSSTADANKVIQFQYRGLENPFGEVWEFEDGFQKYQNVEGAIIRNNSNTSELYTRDKTQDVSGAYAWTNATTGTIWTASATPSNNSASYTDSAKTTSTGFTVNITSYRRFDGEYWHTNATADYTSTDQHAAANPVYWRYAFDWPAEGWMKTIDPETLLVTSTGSPASGTKRFRDYFYNANTAGSRVSFVGGNAYYGASVGMGCRGVNSALTDSRVIIGGRASA